MEQTQVVAKQQMTNVKVLPWPLAAGIPQFLPAAVPCGPGGPAPAYTCAQAENHCVDTLTCVHVYCTYYIYRRAKTAANMYSSGGRYMDVVTPQNMWQTYGRGDPTEYVADIWTWWPHRICGRHMDVVTLQNMWQTYGCGDPTEYVADIWMWWPHRFCKLKHFFD